MSTIPSKQLEPVHIERGLLSVFRHFVIWPFIVISVTSIWDFIIIALGLQSVHETNPVPHLAYAGFVENLLLLLYLQHPDLLGLLRKAYLPIAVGSGTVILLLGIYGQFMLKPALLIDGQFLAATPAFLLLLFPMLLVSWQYTFKEVFIYIALSAAFELALIFFLGSFYGGVCNLYALLFNRTVLSLLIGYMISRLMLYQREQRRELAEANQKLMNYADSLQELTTARERNRLARELHDTLAHHMSGMVLQLEATKVIWGRDADKALNMLEESIQTTRMGLDETRRALKSLRASVLDDIGLLEAIRSLAEEASQRGTFALSLDLPQRIHSMHKDIEHNVYRIAQETLNNIVQHAQASTVCVVVAQTETLFYLQIQDDGTGFDRTLDLSENHFGLLGLQERANTMMAQLSIRSQEGEGTEIELHVPIHVARASS